MTPKNLFHHLPKQDLPEKDLPPELLQTLTSATPTASLRIERIQSPPNHASPPDFYYDQPTTEWVLLLQGSAIILLA